MLQMKLSNNVVEQNTEAEMLNALCEEVLKILTPEMTQACLALSKVVLDKYLEPHPKSGNIRKPKIGSYIVGDEISVSASKLGSQDDHCRLLDWTDDYVVLGCILPPTESDYENVWCEVIVCEHDCIRDYNRWCF